MKLDNNAVGQTLTFTTVAGEKLRNLKLISFLDAQTLLAIGEDPVAGHRQYLPFIPDPKPVRYTDYLYAKFIDANSVPSYYGIPWIIETSIESGGNVPRIMRLPDATDEQIESLKTMALKSGIENFSFEYVNP